MNCRMADMRNKEVINIKDGTRLGCVCDVEIDTSCAKVYAIVIYGRLRLFGLLGREDDIVIKWDDIEAVSYTHLDVYKRQALGLSARLLCL